ncbi:MAG: hypothetical protein Q9220_006314 [cf. Caloplaca sp. 1 TL-2023]
MDANQLVNRPAEVTRSTVQKAVVVIAESPQLFGHLREKLSMVTGAWFAQRDFTDVDILKKFQESLSQPIQHTEDDREVYLGFNPSPFVDGLSLRELIHEYKHQTLVLFKCILLQPKYSIISLIPLLLTHLSSAASPSLSTPPTPPPSSLKTSDRTSLLTYMGLPLHLFGAGSLFGPYTPLQQLDLLLDTTQTKSYIVGSTNALLLQQEERYSDVFVNLDESSIHISSPALRSALVLSAADRRWIDFLTQTVTSTWDPLNPSRPTTLAYLGSEEFIRLQFEEYLLALLASVKYHFYTTSSTTSTNPTLTDHQQQQPQPDPIIDFNPEWLTHWQLTPSFALFNSTTDPHLFDIVEPRHPTAGAFSIDDIQRRITQQIQYLHLDDRFASTRENLNRHLLTGKKQVGAAFEKLKSEYEVMQAQRRRGGDEGGGTSTPNRATSTSSAHSTPPPAEKSLYRFSTPSTPDLGAAQASVAAAGQRAGAYVSSWGTWAAEKRKGWGRGGGAGSANVGSGGGGGSGGWVKGFGGMGRAGGEEKIAETGVQRSPGKKKSREERGGDGIGRLDA